MTAAPGGHLLLVIYEQYRKREWDAVAFIGGFPDAPTAERAKATELDRYRRRSSTAGPDFQHEIRVEQLTAPAAAEGER